MQAVHFKRKLGPRGSGGDWDPDTAVSHVYRGDGHTLCGIGVGRLLHHRGPWEINNWPEHQTTCKRCQSRRKQERK